MCQNILRILEFEMKISFCQGQVWHLWVCQCCNRFRAFWKNRLWAFWKKKLAWDFDSSWLHFTKEYIFEFIGVKILNFNFYRFCLSHISRLYLDHHQLRETLAPPTAKNITQDPSTNLGHSWKTSLERREFVRFENAGLLKLILCVWSQ